MTYISEEYWPQFEQCSIAIAPSIVPFSLDLLVDVSTIVPMTSPPEYTHKNTHIVMEIWVHRSHYGFVAIFVQHVHISRHLVYIQHCNLQTHIHGNMTLWGHK